MGKDNVQEVPAAKTPAQPAQPQPAQPPQFHVVPSPLLQAILNYLQTKPFNEVADLIGAVMREAKPVGGGKE
jgi:hypothetical protein